MQCRQTDRQALECDQVSVSGVVDIYVQPESMIKGNFIETEAH